MVGRERRAARVCERLGLTEYPDRLGVVKMSVLAAVETDEELRALVRVAHRISVDELRERVYATNPRKAGRRPSDPVAKARRRLERAQDALMAAEAARADKWMLEAARRVESGQPSPFSPVQPPASPVKITPLARRRAEGAQ